MKRSPKSQRHGLTLIELVLAIGGAAMLLALILSLVASQARLMDRCQSTLDTTRAHLRVSQWLRQDLSKIVLPADTGINNSFASNVRERVLQFNYQLANEPLSLYGESDFLAIGNFTPDVEPSKRGASLKYLSTIWTARPDSLITVPYLASDLQTRFQPARSVANQAAPVGLIRASYHVRETAEVVEKTTFAEAVVAVSFRYLDGERWQDQWNSKQQGRLPDAIEVTLDCQGQPEPHRFIHALLTHDIHSLIGRRP